MPASARRGGAGRGGAGRGERRPPAGWTPVSSSRCS